MTTIAYDGKIIAGDTRVTADGFIADDDFIKVRKFKVNDQTIIAAGAGTLTSLIKFFAWVESGADVLEWNQDREDDFVTGLIISGESVAYFHNCVIAINHQIPFAIGSGAELATGAMLAGKNAVEAVKIASLRDTATNSKVTGFKRGKNRWTSVPSRSTN